MIWPEVTDFVAAIGGLGGLGALITSLATLAKTRQVRDDTRELKPNHGSSVADKQDQTLDLIRSQGHQLGEHHRLMMHILDQIDAIGDRVTLIEHRKDRHDTP